MSTASAPHFFVTLLHSSTQAHLLHFKSNSYAQHIALGDLYDGLADKADSLVENYQGIHGVVTEYPSITFTCSDDPIAFVEALQKYISDNRACVGKETQLQNQVDEIATLVDTALYKLKNLK